MLFETQREDLTGFTHDLYFTAGALLQEGVLAFVTGVRTKMEPHKIVANVEYLYEDGKKKQAFNKELSPADFERFLNNFAMKVATISKGLCKLVELNHHFTPLDDNRFMMLTDEDKNVALRSYLLQLITGNPQREAAAEAISTIKSLMKQYN